MQGEYRRDHSAALGREMECKVFGSSGKVCLAFPPQNGRFFDFEDNGMVEVVEPWIATGRLQLVLVDSIDAETWSDPGGDYHSRIESHEQWFSYVVDELLPGVEADNPSYASGDETKAMTTGCSMGGFHAANSFFRRPDLFDATISLSGIYTADFFFPHYNDPTIYENSPEDFLANMPEDHPYMALYRKSSIVLCVGQGAWEDDMLASTHRMEDVLARKGIPAWVDYWGHDVNHDWPWWQKQLPYFMGYLL